MPLLYNSYVFHLPCEAHADSTMFTRAGFAYTPKNKRDYQRRLLSSCNTLREDFPIPIRTPVLAVWTFFILRPKGVHRSVDVKSTKPDTDGYLKTPKDAIQVGPLSKKAKNPLIGLGIVENDSLIFSETTQKLFVSKPEQQLTSLMIWTKPESLQNGKIKNFQWKICPREILSCLVTLGASSVSLQE